MNRHCLIVDDSATVRHVLRNSLNQLGWTCSEAPTGMQALEQMAKSSPTLVLLDWNMPVMDGLTCLKAIRAKAILPRPIVVLCTSESSISKIREALEAGADEYIMKPIDIEILTGKLAQLGLLEAGRAA
jgi:two-component system chemotaxis response regulator CheY